MAIPPPTDIADTMLSRSGRSDAGGKLVQRLDIPVSDELETGLITLATLAGMPRAEYARRILMIHVFGELGMAQRMARPPSDRQWDESPTPR